MKASELRKGNLLLGSEDQVVIVECINRDGSVGIAGNSSRFGVESDVTCLIPIPLTEEWLDKTMFEKSSNLICGDYTIRIDEIGCLGIWLETGRYSFMDWNTGDIFTSHDNRIEYVHQLQNIYFALTGEELEFK